MTKGESETKFPAGDTWRIPKPKAYFEPENLDALVEVFTEAKRLLKRQKINDPDQLDEIARHIFDLAAKGDPPWSILNKVIPPLSVEEAGLPKMPSDDDIRFDPTGGHA